MFLTRTLLPFSDFYDRLPLLNLNTKEKGHPVPRSVGVRSECAVASREVLCLGALNPKP